VDLEQTDSAPPGTLARRRLLRAGVGGAALSLLPMLARHASATTPDTAPGNTEPAPVDAEPASTTTAPPQRPTADDIPLLTFAQSVEMVAVERYTAAIAAAEWSSDEAVVLGTIREGHLGYVNALAGMLGRDGITQPEPAVEAEIPEFGTSAAAILAAAGAFESVAVATNLELIGELQGTSPAALLAAVVSVEARNGTALASLAGNTSIDGLLVTGDAVPLRPSATAAAATEG
jgi:Ferritin-like domain